MSQFVFSGAELLTFSLDDLKNWHPSGLTPEELKEARFKFQTHQIKTDPEEIFADLETTLSTKPAHLNELQSLALTLALESIGQSVGDLNCSVEIPRSFKTAYKKWSKVLFETAESFESANSGHVGTISADPKYVVGFVDRTLLSKLKKVDELHDYLEKRELELKASFESRRPKKPELVFDLNPVATAAKGPSLLGLDGRPLGGREKEQRPAKKRPKLNELEKEEKNMDIDTADIGSDFVRSVYRAKQSNKDLVILTRWMEILN
jgi:hypothetical protein